MILRIQISLKLRIPNLTKSSKDCDNKPPAVTKLSWVYVRLWSSFDCPISRLSMLRSSLQGLRGIQLLYVRPKGRGSGKFERQTFAILSLKKTGQAEMFLNFPESVSNWQWFPLTNPSHSGRASSGQIICSKRILVGKNHSPCWLHQSVYSISLFQGEPTIKVFECQWKIPDARASETGMQFPYRGAIAPKVFSVLK